MRWRQDITHKIGLNRNSASGPAYSRIGVPDRRELSVRKCLG